ncbi:MAG: 3-dehydroquinate synthase [Bacillales bacterium]|jgi:3-dehydroquinate synthase|nr:3-dehydroquinate synthase [Bacillales bacterium]
MILKVNKKKIKLKINKKTTPFALFENLSNEHKVVFLIDEIFLNLLKKDNIIALKGGEEIKTLNKYIDIIDYLQELNLERNDYLIAVGGGTITDLGGFVASTFKRGLNFISVPTTTLAMIDAGIGGKNGLNNGVKNVLGTFYQPQEIYLDYNLLKSLPENIYYDGFVEALKMTLLTDNQDLSLYNDVRTHEREIIETAIFSKMKYVEEDEFDNKGKRIELNFGHTLGHAIEAYCLHHNLPISHGQAVATGMHFMIRDLLLRDKVRDIINNRFKISYFTDFVLDDLKQYLVNDKKKENNLLQLVFLDGIKDVKIEKLSVNDFIEYLKGIKI